MTVEAKRRALIERVSRPMNGRRLPATTLTDGNAGEHSIAANLLPHPGIAAFRSELEALDAAEDVAAVRIAIVEAGNDVGDWPCRCTVPVLTTRTPEGMADALDPLRPDEVGALAATPLDRYPLMSRPGPRSRVVFARWD